MTSRTVKSLIEQLQKLSPDTEVWGWDDGSIIFNNNRTGEDGLIECLSFPGGRELREEIHFNNRGKLCESESWE